MSTAIQKQLESVFQRVAHLEHAMTYLGWDQMVMMPPAGLENRAAAMAELASLRHTALTSPELVDWFDALSAETESEAGLTEHASLREMKRVWQAETVLPADLVAARIVAGARCEQAWRDQRFANDWQGFLANFTEVVALAREEAKCRQAAAPDITPTPYDALLALHCAGDSADRIDAVFSVLKNALPELLDQVVGKQQSEPLPNCEGHFQTADQQALNHVLMRVLGFDFNAGRLDVSMHPFSTGERGDSRITTRFKDTEFTEALLATAHETGHASYEAGLPDEWQGLPVGQSRNMCIHESQSLLFEKHIAQSKPFLEALMPRIHEHLSATRHLNADGLWRSLTRVRPSFIRVEADEITYPLHVSLRYDIERALINGDLQPKEIPDAWDVAMQSLLGLSTGDQHHHGCLQDVHWSDGTFGYFPSYTMGAVNAAQLMATLRQTYPDWQTQLAAGDVTFIREWLRTTIWQQGGLLESQPLMEHATGESSNPQHLLDHLRLRYLEQAW